MSAPDDQPHTRTRYPAGAPSPGAPEAGGRRSLRTLVAVLAVVAVLVLAVAVLNRTGGSTTTATTKPSTGAAKTGTSSGDEATAPTGTQPVTTTQNGIATGFPHTSEGAQSAAVNYAVALGSAEMYADTSRHTILHTITDPSAESAMQARSDSSYTAQAKIFGLVNGAAPAGETFVSRTIPVGSKNDSYSSGAATVEVWCNALGGIAGTGSTKPVAEYWFTEVLQLRWVNGDWKMSGYNQKDGPVPISGSQAASDSGAISSAVSQFGGFRYAR